MLTFTTPEMKMIDIGLRLSFNCRTRRPCHPDYYSKDNSTFKRFKMNWDRWIYRPVH